MDLIKYFKYRCVCTYMTNNKQSYCAHTRHCKLYRYFVKKVGKLCPTPFFRKDGNKPLWNKGFTKYTHPSIANQALHESITFKNQVKNGTNSLVNWNKDTSSESRINSFRRQSETRIRRYLTGELNISPIRARRGIGSFILINGSKHFLRSSYEFYIAIYFYLKGYKFGIEEIRVKRLDKNKTCVSDFNIGKRVFEVKPKIDMVDPETIKAFISNGYKYYIIDHKIVNNVRNKLNNMLSNINEVTNDMISTFRSGSFYVLDPSILIKNKTIDKL